MTMKHVLVRDLNHVRAVEDVADAPVLAVIIPPDRVLGTDDAALVGRIRDALADDRPVWYDPIFQGTLVGPATAHDAESLAWVITVAAGLVRQGLAADPIGWAWPEYMDDPPGVVYGPPV